MLCYIHIYDSRYTYTAKHIHLDESIHTTPKLFFLNTIVYYYLFHCFLYNGYIYIYIPIGTLNLNLLLLSRF